MIYAINGLRFQRQADTNWCWAAVSWMVLDFYSRGQGILQCDIASRVTGGLCCPSPPPNRNDPCYNLMNLETALNSVGHSAGSMIPQPQDFTLVKNEIIAQRPICAQMALPGVNHYVALSTCADDGSIRVLDPEGWYDTDFTTFTRFDLQNPRGFCTGWFLTSPRF
jgi:hypothetical protein